MKRHFEVIIIALALCVAACSSKKEQVGPTVTPEIPNPPVDTGTSDDTGLWEDDTTNDETATNTTPIVPETGSDQWACLTGETNSTTASSGTASTTNTCFQQAYGEMFGEQDLLNAAEMGFGLIQGCYDHVMSRGPQMCSSPSKYPVKMIFEITKLALVRCFRDILHQQMEMAEWSRPQVQAFQADDSELHHLLFLIDEEE